MLPGGPAVLPLSGRYPRSLLQGMVVVQPPEHLGSLLCLSSWSQPAEKGACSGLSPLEWRSEQPGAAAPLFLNIVLL